MEDCNIQEEHDSGQVFVEKRDTYKKQGSREKCTSDPKSLSSVHVKPSFPAKKRVQVPPSQSEGDLDETGDKLSGKSSGILKKKLVVDEKEGPDLAPFFWLRDEENVENLSQTQHTGTDPFSNMPLPDVPTFSDIKESDDENSSRLAPEVSIY